MRNLINDKPSAMGAEVLEEGTVEPFMADYETKCSDKKVALFGSYGWGDGQWMRDWQDRLVAAGAFIIGGEGVNLCPYKRHWYKRQCLSVSIHVMHHNT